MSSNFLESFIKLIPFFVGVFIYFYFPPKQLPFLQRASIKCFPILALMGFLYLRKTKNSDEYKCRKLILSGLALSCIGDAFLIQKNLFIPGMLAFALAHFMYILALGFHLVELKCGCLLYGICIVNGKQVNCCGDILERKSLTLQLYENLLKKHIFPGKSNICMCVYLVLYILMPGLTGPLIYAVPIYGFILATMTWRSLAAMNTYKIESWWLSRITGIGGLLWMTSDAVLAYNKFVDEVPYQDALIMVSYYLGQLGITLSSLICWRKYDGLMGAKKSK
uniref:lysoplasmalogenase n=1 Tax=Rhodnius prolixus TaxID=13249 RepID=T1I556_RHOPR